jgi:Flp pilus assembly protein TadG
MQTVTTLHRSKRKTIWHLRARVRNEQASALVELAILLSLFSLMLVGAFEIAMAAYTSIEVSNAALAGVQYGAQSAATAGDTTGIQTAATNDAPNITLGTTTVTESCICSDGSASTCKPTDCSGSNIETILKVQTQATFTPAIKVPGLPASFTLNGEAVQKVLQ